MRCLQPIYVKWIDKENGQVVGSEVPCGKCANCITNYHQQWIYRLYYEQKISSLCLFVTLTYDDEHLPLFNGCPSVNKRDVQLFNKRLRERLSCIQIDNPHNNEKIEEENKKIRSGFYRYYIASEYGSNTLRPHYHGILFFSWSVLEDRLKIEDAISKSWDFGFVNISDVNINSIAYCTKYVLKEQPNTNGLPPFSLTSRRPGLGYQYCIDMRSWHNGSPEKMYVVMPGGQKYPLPRYFKDKLNFDTDVLKEFAEQRKVENQIKYEKMDSHFQQHYKKSYAHKKFESKILKESKHNKNKEFRSKKQKL